MSDEAIKLTTPLSDEDVAQLRIGDRVLLSGTVYTARDAAHMELFKLLDAGKELPFDLKGSVIYYVGPTPAKPGQVIGSAGPTSSYRMDGFAPKLHQLGNKATIGKGKRGPELLDALKEHNAVYLSAIGGAAALISQQIVSCEIIAFPELGPEAIRKLEIKDFNTVVAMDSQGGNIYVEGMKQYARTVD
jgi:fumarate hydratase subunit beta